MHLTTAWIVPLAAAGAGAVALGVVAAGLRREVARLQRAMRPLRTASRHRPAPGEPRR